MSSTPCSKRYGMVIFPRHIIFHALPSELQEAVQLGDYVLPDLYTLLTSHLQEQELQRLREYMVVSHKTLQDDSKRIRKLISTFGTNRGSSSNNMIIDANCMYSITLAEQTLRGNSDTLTRANKPIVKRTNRTLSPQNPINIYIYIYISVTVILIFGCLGCGSTDHTFDSIPVTTKEASEIFFGKNCGIRFLRRERKINQSHLLLQLILLSPQLKSLLPHLFHLLLTRVTTPILLLGNNETTLKALVFSRYLLAFPIFPLLSVNLCISPLITLFYQLVFN